jgi:hypothetical protein
MRRGTPKRDAFDLKCYSVVQGLPEPVTAGAVAKQIRHSSVEVRRVLERLERQKALLRKRIRGTWHYYV